MKKKQVTLNQKQSQLLQDLLSASLIFCDEKNVILLEDIINKIKHAAWISDDSEQTPNNGETPINLWDTEQFKSLIRHFEFSNLNAVRLGNSGYTLVKDNPVGQIFTAIELEMLTLILNADNHISVENRNYFLTKLRSISKPRETDNGATL